MTKLAVETLPDLSRCSLPTAVRWMEQAGFRFHDVEGGGGYREFRHPDGSEIWIRPSGEIVRLGPKVTGKHRARYDQRGKKTASNNTGEKLSP